MTLTVTPLAQTVRVELVKSEQCPDMETFSDLSSDLDNAFFKSMQSFEASVRLISQIYKVKLKVTDND